MTELKIEPIEIDWELPASVVKTKSNIRIIFYKISDVVVECLFFIFMVFYAIVKDVSKYSKKKKGDKK